MTSHEFFLTSNRFDYLKYCKIVIININRLLLKLYYYTQLLHVLKH